MALRLPEVCLHDSFSAAIAVRGFEAFLSQRTWRNMIRPKQHTAVAPSALHCVWSCIGVHVLTCPIRLV